jgi:hypothetical protein
LFFSFQLKSSNVKIPLYLHGDKIRAAAMRICMKVNTIFPGN